MSRADNVLRTALLGLALLLAAPLAGCEGDETAAADRHTATSHLVGTEKVRSGVRADVYLPDRNQQPPVVLLVPGGGWTTADRSALRQLAEHLATAGTVVVNTTYRTQETETFFPTPVRDVVCALDFAAAKAKSKGMAGGPLVVVGHSAGAQLAALAGLAGDQFQSGCPYPPAQADGVIGLAGPYDLAKVEDAARPLFGKTFQEAPQLWRAANPFTWAANRPELRVLLVHGTADDIVPAAMSADFEKALRDGGHQVKLNLMQGADHADIFQADQVGSVLTKWIAALKPATS